MSSSKFDDIYEDDAPGKFTYHGQSIEDRTHEGLHNGRVLNSAKEIIEGHHLRLALLTSFMALFSNNTATSDRGLTIRKRQKMVR